MLFKKRKEKIAGAFKKGLGVDAFRAGWSIIRLPVDVLREQRRAGEDPEELKTLSFDDLLDKWEIPAEKVPYLKRVLIAEMTALLLLASYGFAWFVYSLLTSDYFTGLIGLVVGFAAFFHLLLRHHWYSILADRKYQTFKEYIFGGRRE